MFGLENKKKKGDRPDDETFDFEIEMRDAAKRKERERIIDTRIQEVKKALREGGEREGIDELGVLLHGYAALKKVIARIGNK